MVVWTKDNGYYTYEMNTYWNNGVDSDYNSSLPRLKLLNKFTIQTEVSNNTVTNGKEIIIVNTKSNKVDEEKSVRLEESSETEINFVTGDKHRVIVGTNNNLLKIYSVQDGKVWYNLKGGSLTVVPKSFALHPVYKWFHLVCMTRLSVIGVLGNLIREYSFKLGVC